MSGLNQCTFDPWSQCFIWFVLALSCGIYCKVCISETRPCFSSQMMPHIWTTPDPLQISCSFYPWVQFLHLGCIPKTTLKWFVAMQRRAFCVANNLALTYPLWFLSHRHAVAALKSSAGIILLSLRTAVRPNTTSHNSPLYHKECCFTTSTMCYTD